MALRHTVPWCSLASKKRGGFELNITDSNDVGPLKSVLTKLGSRLKIAADFVVQVYESELLRRNLAYRAESDYSTQLGGNEPPY